MPSRLDCLHCSRRWIASMPSGEEEEIVDRGEPLVFLIAPAAVRALFAFLTKIPNCFENRVDDLIAIWQSRLTAAASCQTPITGASNPALQLKATP
jgi:hypothetical protein